MANLATTATESLQCIASAIRQQEGGSISSADLLDFLEYLLIPNALPNLIPHLFYKSDIL